MVEAPRFYDLHLHSTYSDGDWSPVQLVQQAAARGLDGISLTDHNGTWGIAETRAAATATGLGFLAGIEVTARYGTTDIHLLGYSQAFDETVLHAGLASTRAGYEERVRGMIERCHAAGYHAVSWTNIAASRQRQAQPVYVSHDVARQLIAHHHVDITTARQLTTRGGACYVPYGTWALSPQAAVDLVHQAGGVAVLAHPGTIAHDTNQAVLHAVLKHLQAIGLDGIEAVHPFHGPAQTAEFEAVAQAHGWLVTGGSDWHGPGRFNDQAFGSVGVDEDAWQELLRRLE